MSVAAAFTDGVGTVTSFDDHIGAGMVTDDATGETWYFHCTRISGDQRSVPVAAAVTYRVVLGPTGLEATNVSLR